MKKVNIILNIVLILAVAALYILHFTGAGKQSSSQASGSESVTAVKGDIVYINLDTLVNQYDMYNDLRSELQGKVSAIETLTARFSRAIEKVLGIRVAVQRDQELRNLTQQKQMEMAEEESVMYNKVMDAITTYVENYNKDKQYSLILTTTAATTTVINGNGGLNITEEIVNGLNAEYIKNRNK